MRDLTTEELRQVINHVFLPPKLPQSEDGFSELALVNLAFDALCDMRGFLGQNNTPQALDNAIAILDSIRAINSLPNGKTDEEALQKSLADLKQGQSIAMRVTEQNAAVIITRKFGDNSLVFEEFELSPTNESVFSTKGRLVRDFPGLAVAVDATLIHKTDFARTISQTIATMCHQAAPNTQPQSVKSGVSHDEIRNTTHPLVVSELFFGFLSGFGNATHVTSISKNTREEVLWDNAKEPWRRSPMWLLIRVSMQLAVVRSIDGSHELYKLLMLYILTFIPWKDTRPSLPTDVLWVMSAKINRRLQKLAGSDPDLFYTHAPIIKTVRDNLSKISQYLYTEWDTVQARNSRLIDMSTLANLDIEQDTLVELGPLDEHIAEIRSRPTRVEPIQSMPTPENLIGLDTTFPSSSILRSTAPYYVTAANLRRFEFWVATELPIWTSRHNTSIAYTTIWDAMTAYHGHAKEFYSSLPEATSSMLLTIFQLWVAIDQAAIRECPMLGEYRHGIPTSILHELLLTTSEEMRILVRLEAYLDSRNGGLEADSLFDIESDDCFASRLFSISPPSQNLKTKIESDARMDRGRTGDKFRDTMNDRSRLESLILQNPHQRQAIEALEALKLHIHEWPLPEADAQARAVALELQVPSWFAHWRDSRMFLLKDVLGGTLKKSRLDANFQLEPKDPLLKRYFTPPATGSIGLLSEVKPTCKTHFKWKQATSLSAESDVYVANSMKYRYFDLDDRVRLGPFRYPFYFSYHPCKYKFQHIELQCYLWFCEERC